MKQRFIVALAEQLEVPQPNRLVRRDVVRFVTPGTLIEDQLLDGKQNNYLAAMAMAGETFALAYADVSTSYAAATALGGDNAVRRTARRARARRAGRDRRGRARGDARRASPARRERRRACWRRSGSELVEDARTADLDGFSIEESPAIHRALDALGAFVKRTGVTNGERGLGAPQLYRRQEFLVLDPATRKHLELTRAQGANPHATLLATLDLCATQWVRGC